MDPVRKNQTDLAISLIILLIHLDFSKTSHSRSQFDFVFQSDKNNLTAAI